jgi:hypothetical protein
MAIGDFVKMFFRKSRDLLVTVATRQESFEGKFDTHIEEEKEIFKNQGKRFDGLEELIKECHGTCSESGHIKTQNGTLLRMEKKYDKYMTDQTELKGQVAAMKTAKKTKREMLADAGKILGAVALICGIFFGIMKYVESCKAKETTKIEMMLEKILEK